VAGNASRTLAVKPTMRVLFLTFLLSGCTTIDDQQAWLDANDPAARIVLDGSQILTISTSATLTGPIDGGAPYTIDGAVINDVDWNVIDSPVLTTGDQFWVAYDERAYAVDTRTAAPASLIAACGNDVYFQFTFGTTMMDGHQEGAGAIVDTYVECF
jgi:hypothetical protein